METNSFAWIPTFQKTASSIHLESGKNFGLILSLFCLLCQSIEVLLVTFLFSLISFSKQWEFEDVMDQLKCKVVNILETPSLMDVAPSCSKWDGI